MTGGGMLSMKMKRKDLEEVYDDFSDFSLSSPAKKIRRLDAELPPIIEEEEAGVPLEVDPPLLGEGILPEILPDGVKETVPSVPLNEERALVLYKPVNTPFSLSPSSPGVSITVNSDMIQGFKSQVFWPNHTNVLNSAEDRADSTEKTYGTNDNSLAVIPWVSQQLPTAAKTDLPVNESSIAEPMDAEGGAMEIEVEGNSSEEQASNVGSLSEDDGLQRWQQQHCFTPQLPQNTATPVMWSW